MHLVHFLTASYVVLSTRVAAQTTICRYVRFLWYFESLFERHKCFVMRRHLFITTFVCGFCLCKITIFIAFVAMKPFHYIDITVQRLHLCK